MHSTLESIGKYAATAGAIIAFPIAALFLLVVLFGGYVAGGAWLLGLFRGIWELVTWLFG